jgi:hypothetical protein
MQEWDSAQRMLREYGDRADAECDARRSYYEMLGDTNAVEEWKRIRIVLTQLRAGGRQPQP